MTHFDVKPANIIIRKEDDKPLLIDFGLSKQYDSNGDATSTMMQAVSHGYSPIELYNAGSVSEFSPQTDVYSLGATLYYLIAGRVPPHPAALIEGVLCLNSNNHEINYIVKESMQLSKENRIKSIRDLIAKLKNINLGKDGNLITEDGADKTYYIIPSKNQNEMESETFKKKKNFFNILWFFLFLIRLETKSNSIKKCDYRYKAYVAANKTMNVFCILGIMILCFLGIFIFTKYVLNL